MKNSTAKNVLLAAVSLALALTVFELIALKFLHVSDQWPNNSFWMKEKWLDNHPVQEKNTTNYSIDKYDSLLGWKPVENLRNVELSQGWKVNTNSKGIRGTKEYSRIKTVKIRIVTIGDSFTFGECVNDSQTFPAVLEKLLDSAEVINLAVHGYAHDQQLLRLINEGLAYQPDIVLLGFLNDDIDRNELTFRDFAKPYFVLQNDTLELQGVPVPDPDFFKNQFHLKSCGLLRCAFIEQNYNYNHGFTFSPVSESILEKMIYVTEKAGAKFMSVYLPCQSECEQNQPGRHPIFDSLANDKSVTLIDPTTPIHQFLKSEKNVQKHFECHYSPEVYALIAKQIANTIQKPNNP